MVPGYDPVLGVVFDGPKRLECVIEFFDQAPEHGLVCILEDFLDPLYVRVYLDA